MSSAESAEREMLSAECSGSEVQGAESLLESLVLSEEGLGTSILSRLPVFVVCRVLAPSCRRFNQLTKVWFPWRATALRNWQGSGMRSQERNSKMSQIFTTAAQALAAQVDSEGARSSAAWPTHTVPLVLNASALLTRVGEYNSAEEVLISAFGATTKNFPDDHAVQGGFPQYLEAALAVVLAKCGFEGILAASQPHIRATTSILCRLAKVADEQRQTQSLGLKMLPSAIRAEAYSNRVLEIWKGGAEVEPRVLGEAIYLFAVNKAWHLSIIDSWRSSDQSCESFEFGLDDCLQRLIQLDQLCDETGNKARKATVLHGQGTVFLARAAHFNNLPESRHWYEMAEKSFYSALEALTQAVGAKHLLTAACSIDICHSTTLRRKRTSGGFLDQLGTKNQEALRLYLNALQIRRDSLGTAHPLTVAAEDGFKAAQTLITAL